MQKDTLDSTFEELHDLVEQMKAALQWQKLKLMEQSRLHLSSLYFPDTTAQQVMDLRSRFHSVAFRLHQFLNKEDIPESTKNKILKKLSRLELEQQYLGSGIRFY